MANLMKTADRMAQALNFQYGCHIVIDTHKFYGSENRVVRLRIVRDSSRGDGEYINDELFKSASAVYICFFLRDLLKYMKGEEIPDSSDDEGWTRIRTKNNVDGVYEHMRKVYGTHEL